MRRVTIVVTCDACEEEIAEEVEGSSAVRFTMRGEEKEMDLCDECIGGILQEARPVVNRRKRKPQEKPFACFCGKAFTTDRGLRSHKTRQAH